MHHTLLIRHHEAFARALTVLSSLLISFFACVGTKKGNYGLHMVYKENETAFTFVPVRVLCQS